MESNQKCGGGGVQHVLSEGKCNSCWIEQLLLSTSHYAYYTIRLSNHCFGCRKLPNWTSLRAHGTTFESFAEQVYNHSNLVYFKYEGQHKCKPARFSHSIYFWFVGARRKWKTMAAFHSEHPSVFVPPLMLSIHTSDKLSAMKIVFWTIIQSNIWRRMLK